MDDKVVATTSCSGGGGGGRSGDCVRPSAVSQAKVELGTKMVIFCQIQI